MLSSGISVFAGAHGPPAKQSYYADGLHPSSHPAGSAGNHAAAIQKGRINAPRGKSLSDVQLPFDHIQDQWLAGGKRGFALLTVFSTD